MQIKNEMDEPEWWLIVHYDDRLQFRQFSILKCTWTYKWVSRIGGKRRIFECIGAPRKQNSYNSGVNLALPSSNRWVIKRVKTVDPKLKDMAIPC